MKNPPRPRRQPRPQQPSAPASPSSGSSIHEASAAAPSAGAPAAPPAPALTAQPGEAPVAPSPVTSPSAHPSPTDAPSAARATRERLRRERYAGQGAQLAREARERKARGTRTEEQGRAIRRMRSPMGADDAADILGPREEAPQEARVERIEERLRARKRLSALHLASAVGAVVLGAVLVWVVFFSALFALSVEGIQINSPAENSPSEEVHTQVLPFVGTPLTRLSTAEVEERIESIPQVKDATVSKRWPNGVEVTFSLRTPVLVTQVDGAFVTVDEDGIELARLDQRPSGLPLVLFPDGVESREQNTRGVNTAWAALSEELRGRVESMTVANHQLTIALQDGRQVRWGTLTDEALKARVLEVLVNQREAKIYDVSSPTSPVTSG